VITFKPDLAHSLVTGYDIWGIRHSISDRLLSLSKLCSLPSWPRATGMSSHMTDLDKVHVDKMSQSLAIGDNLTQYVTERFARTCEQSKHPTVVIHLCCLAGVFTS